MKVALVLLLLAPVVLGGNIKAMLEELNEEMDKGGWKGSPWGDEKKEDDKKEGWEEMMKGMTWGEEKKPEEKEWGDSKWGDGKWGDGKWGDGKWGDGKWGDGKWGDGKWGDGKWGDGKWGDGKWGDSDGKWGDGKWGDSDGKWGDSGDSDGKWGDADNKWGEGADDAKAELYKEFQEWAKGQTDEQKNKEEFKAYMMKNMLKFKQWKEMKKMKELEEKEAKMAMYKQMQKIKMKKMLTEKLYSLSQEYMQEKMKFTFGIAHHFLGFCQCESFTDILMRVKEGRLGDPDMVGMEMGNMPDYDKPDWSSSGDGQYHYANDNSTSMMNGTMPGARDMMEFVSWFNKLDKMEQTKYVLKDLVKVMCASAKEYLYHLKQVGAALAEWRDKNADN